MQIMICKHSQDSLPFWAISVSTVPVSVQCDCWGLLLAQLVLLPASLSLTSPMAHSQLPCPLFLLCSLLMLPSVLLQEVPMPGGLYPVPVTTEEVKEAAAFAVERYNERSKNPNYFKQLNIVKAQSQVVSGMKYYLTVKVGKTVCEKSSGPLPFNGIQQCELFPQDQQEVSLVA
uniref:Cystatin n=1 Tax=Naja naja TaxID=35670 RepID=A0A8C6YI51_NAJNA